MAVEGSSLDRVDLGERELAGDEVDDGDRLVVRALAAGRRLRRLDE
jgi:hypothetical protein